MIEDNTDWKEFRIKETGGGDLSYSFSSESKVKPGEEADSNDQIVRYDSGKSEITGFVSDERVDSYLLSGPLSSFHATGEYELFIDGVSTTRDELLDSNPIIQEFRLETVDDRTGIECTIVSTYRLIRQEVSLSGKDTGFLLTKDFHEYVYENQYKYVATYYPSEAGSYSCTLTTATTEDGRVVSSGNNKRITTWNVKDSDSALSDEQRADVSEMIDSMESDVQSESDSVSQSVRSALENELEPYLTESEIRELFTTEDEFTKRRAEKIVQKLNESDISIAGSVNSLRKMESQ